MSFFPDEKKERKPENEKNSKSPKKTPNPFQKTKTQLNVARDGAWEDVSGQTFLRTLLSMPIGEAKYDVGRPDMCESFQFFPLFPFSPFPFSHFPPFFLSCHLLPFLPPASHSPHKRTDDHVKGMGIDPRSIAQRIMDIRSQLAREWAEDLSDVSEENALLLRESAAASLRKAVAEHPFDSSTDEESGSEEEEGGGKGGKQRGS